MTRTYKIHCISITYWYSDAAVLVLKPKLTPRELPHSNEPSTILIRFIPVSFQSAIMVDLH
eukprot:6189146-Amphidinium_carterae.1